jgi:hypothetical protein
MLIGIAVLAIRLPSELASSRALSFASSPGGS